MPPENYSFLDVAVLDAVRQRFAAGDALAILSADLEQVIWANGPGAVVFGYPDIGAIIGTSARLPLIARRQIMATSGFPDIGSDRAITVRLATGMVSRAVGWRSIRYERRPVDSTASPMRVAVTNKMCISPIRTPYMPHPLACQASGPSHL